MNKRGQVELFGMEINPISIAAGVICGFAVFVMMGNTGNVHIGLIYRVVGFFAGIIGGYLVFNTIMNR